MPMSLQGGKDKRSQTLVFVAAQAAKGNPICIVNDAGYELLVNGLPAFSVQKR